MNLKEHTRNQKRMYRIHKQDEKIHDLELMIGKLQQENKKLNSAIQTYDILLKANTEENKRLKDNWDELKEYCKETKLKSLKNHMVKDMGKHLLKQK